MSYVKKKSDKQEKKLAKAIGGRAQPASGALDGSKGDVTHPLLLIECKFTDAAFYSLTLKTWEKIKREATKQGLKIPIMQIDVQTTRFVVLEQDFLHQLCEVANIIPKCQSGNMYENSMRIKNDHYYSEFLERIFDYDVKILGSHKLAIIDLSDFLLLFDEWKLA